MINSWIFAPCSKLIQPPLTAELVLVLLATLMLIKLLLSWTDLGQWMDRSSAGQEGPKDLLVTQSSNSFLRMICNLSVCLSLSSVLKYFGPFYCLCVLRGFTNTNLFIKPQPEGWWWTFTFFPIFHNYSVTVNILIYVSISILLDITKLVSKFCINLRYHSHQLWMSKSDLFTYSLANAIFRFKNFSPHRIGENSILL